MDRPANLRASGPPGTVGFRPVGQGPEQRDAASDPPSQPMAPLRIDLTSTDPAQGFEQIVAHWRKHPDEFLAAVAAQPKVLWRLPAIDRDGVILAQLVTKLVDRGTQDPGKVLPLFKRLLTVKGAQKAICLQLKAVLDTFGDALGPELLEQPKIFDKISAENPEYLQKQLQKPAATSSLLRHASGLAWIEQKSPGYLKQLVDSGQADHLVMTRQATGHLLQHHPKLIEALCRSQHRGVLRALALDENVVTYLMDKAPAALDRLMTSPEAKALMLVHDQIVDRLSADEIGHMLVHSHPQWQGEVAGNEKAIKKLLVDHSHIVEDCLCSPGFVRAQLAANKAVTQHLEESDPQGLLRLARGEPLRPPFNDGMMRVADVRSAQIPFQTKAAIASNPHAMRFVAEHDPRLFASLALNKGTDGSASAFVSQPENVALLAQRHPATLVALVLFGRSHEIQEIVCHPHVVQHLPGNVLQQLLEIEEPGLRATLAASMATLLQGERVLPMAWGNSFPVDLLIKRVKQHDLFRGTLAAQKQIDRESAAQKERARRKALKKAQEAWKRSRPSSPVQAFREFSKTQSDAARQLRGADGARRVSTLLEQLWRRHGNLKDVKSNFRRLAPGLSEKALWSGQVPPRDPQQVTQALAAQLVRPLEVTNKSLGEAKPGQIAQDVERMTEILEHFPYLSEHEVLVALSAEDQRWTPDYLEFLQGEGLGAELLKLNRPAGGKEPNLLLATHVATAMFNAPQGTTYEDIVSQVDKKVSVIEPRSRFEREDLEALQRVYGFIPVWDAGEKAEGSPNFDELPLKYQQRLSKLRAVGVVSPLLDTVQSNAPIFQGVRMFSVDLPLADNLSYLRDAIYEQGARGADMRFVWKDYPYDPIVVELAERCFGVKGEVATSDKIGDVVEKRLYEAMKEAHADGEILAVHLLGVKRWNWFRDRLEEFPGLRVMAVSHTTSDADEIRQHFEEFPNFSLVVMADSEVKLDHEIEMLSKSFLDLMGSLEDSLEGELPLRGLTAAVFGRAGRLVGPAAHSALDAWGLEVIALDPALKDPARKQDRERLSQDAHIVDLDDKDELFAALNHPNIIVNCSAEHVLTGEMVEMLRGKSVYLNLGTGQKDVELIRSKAQRHFHAGQLGTLPIVGYVIPQKNGEEAIVYMVGDGMVANHNSVIPNPTAKSDVNNLIKRTSFELARKRLEAAYPGESLEPALVESMASVVTDSHREFLVLSALGTPVPEAVIKHLKTDPQIPEALRQEPVVLTTYEDGRLWMRGLVHSSEKIPYLDGPIFE